MRKLKRMFSKLKDPRASNVRHDLLEIIFIALAATLAGARTCTEIAHYGREKEAMLRQILDLPHGIPSHDTFSNVFRALNPFAFEAAFRKFSTAFARAMARRQRRQLGVHNVVTIDGKALRGAYRRGRRTTPLHMVNVWAAGMRMALGQRKAANRNEIAGALELLALLDLDGAIVTADALYCTVAMAEAIRGRGGHYLLALKKNRSKLYRLAEALLAKPRNASRARQSPTKAHGRIERRLALVVPAGEMAKLAGFPDLKAIGRIISWRSVNGRASKRKVRYFLISRKLTAKQLLDIVRAHWGIENNLHWVLDVTFGEDSARTRMDHGPENLAVLRKLAINILQGVPRPIPMRHKVLAAMWGDSFLLEALGHMR
jgi:predicted transposase YbfD/YdcC